MRQERKKQEERQQQGGGAGGEGVFHIAYAQAGARPFGEMDFIKMLKAYIL